ncbi:YbdD/YjiX family protein [Methylomonas montana]|uniref:YbdD/YjiX family protein n=1 Tax=Methylomonas montana TaxID=3058963 RepID=UPI0026583F39|nr:YbdD/YjiX family protein [Methylomonas montana]WKJ89147.1 YbdD/YjiX family protein [Methylomonas montana]
MSKRLAYGWLMQCWRNLNGDAAYERYLAHWRSHHLEEAQAPLSRKAFFAAETRRKWSGVKRCC